MLENPSAPFMEILFPHKKFLYGNILPRNLLPATHPDVKNSHWNRLYTS